MRLRPRLLISLNSPQLPELAHRACTPCATCIPHREMQAAFKQGRASVMVANQAFGMGIDIPDVRRIIHWGVSCLHVFRPLVPVPARLHPHLTLLSPPRLLFFAGSSGH